MLPRNSPEPEPWAFAAPEWVRDNIENFGGDPGNVMIFGQSGGGAKVSALLCMPAAKGLFQRAAIQSGSALRLTPRAAAAESAERMIAQLGLDRSRIAEMQDVPFEMMISAPETLGAQTPPAGFAPVVDRAVIPRNPFDPDAPEISADVPVIVSSTLDDAALGRTDFSLDETGLRQQVRAIAGDRADSIIAAYRGAYPKTTPFLLLCRMLTHRGGRKNAVTLAERKAAQQRAPVYMYLFPGHRRATAESSARFTVSTSAWCSTIQRGPFTPKAPSPHPCGQDGRRLGRIRKNREPQHAGASRVAGVQHGHARHHDLRQQLPRRERSRRPAPKRMGRLAGVIRPRNAACAACTGVASDAPATNPQLAKHSWPKMYKLQIAGVIRPRS